MAHRKFEELLKMQIYNENGFNDTMLAFFVRSCDYNLTKGVFRLRKKEDLPFLERKELFHIPFEKRGVANTQRFSILGYPSLYLSRTIDTAMKELRCKNIDEYYCSSFQLDGPELFLDISTVQKCNGSHLHRILQWPLTAACLVKVKNSEHNFKAEYIIPQMLLSFILQQRKGDERYYHCIRYSSTKEPNSVNYVIPTRDIKKEGYCSYTSSLTKMTMPLLGSDIRRLLNVERFRTYDAVEKHLQGLEHGRIDE